MAKRKENGTHEPVLLSKKHKPTDQSERDRIKKAGGHVVFGRVMGSLAVSRALGDRDFKHPYNKADGDFVSADPFITKIPIQPEDDFLIVSCDGLWDKLSYESAVDLVAQCRNQGKGPEESAQLLVKDSLDRGTSDNVTAIIVFLPQKNKALPSPTNIKPTEQKKLNVEKKKEEKKIKSDSIKSSNEKKEIPENEEMVKERNGEKNGELRNSDSETTPSSRSNEKLKYFKLANEEELLAEFGCMLEKKIPNQGLLLVTTNFLCFYSNFPRKKATLKIPIRDIQCVEKTKSLIVANSIKITTRDGHKYIFNWKQNNMSRDQAFTKLLDLMAQQKYSESDLEKREQPKEENPEDESEDEDEDEEEEGNQEETSKEEKGKNLAWSRFGD